MGTWLRKRSGTPSQLHRCWCKLALQQSLSHVCYTAILFSRPLWFDISWHVWRDRSWELNCKRAPPHAGILNQESRELGLLATELSRYSCFIINESDNRNSERGSDRFLFYLNSIISKPIIAFPLTCFQVCVFVCNAPRSCRNFIKFHPPDHSHWREEIPLKLHQ